MIDIGLNKFVYISVNSYTYFLSHLVEAVPSSRSLTADEHLNLLDVSQPVSHPVNCFEEY